MIVRLRSAVALAATAAVLAACSGGGGTGQFTNPLTPVPNIGTTPQTQLRIVGVGDSLTAGVQSGGLSGVPIPGGANAGPAGTTITMPPTQQNGFYALVFAQANPAINLSDPVNSPLPLMKPLGGILVPTTSGFPAPVTNYCDANQIAANQFATAGAMRLNPNQTPLDVAIPGQTLKESLYMVGPTSDCAIAAAPASFPANIVGLNSLIMSEGENFSPVMFSFGPGVPQVNAAAALHGQLATVWLGSNELLKFIFSGGNSPVPSFADFQNDMNDAIARLQGSGAKVAVATLVDVLGAGTFFPVTGSPVRPSYAQQISGALQAQGVPKPAADAVAGQYAGAEIAQTGLTPGGLFTLNAFLNTLAAIKGSQPPPTIPASQVVTASLAAQAQGLNDGYNAAIRAAVAANSGAILVDINKTVRTAAAAGGIPINPPKCCSFIYGGGFFSLDGIHPSNTGYAVIAKTFIDSINAANAGITIPAIDAKIPAIYAGDIYAPH